jgi:hypothetical protein
MSARSLWFVMPAHGRVDLARVCMRQLARTIDAIRDAGIDAHAVVVACDENLDSAHELGFGTVERDNLQLGRRWNDGFQLAWEQGVDYLVPIGSDDWLDPRWITEYDMPGPQSIRCMTRLCMVDETGRTMRRMRVRYDGGVGIRIIPASLLDAANGRPCVEDRQRAIDATTLRRLQQLNRHEIALSYRDLRHTQLVDWKSSGEQLNPFASCGRYADDLEPLDPFVELADVFPAAALDEMRAVYHDQEVSV